MNAKHPKRDTIIRTNGYFRSRYFKNIYGHHEIIKEAQKTERHMEKKCSRAPRNTFAKQTILLDISHNEKTLLMNMKSKTRYNIRYAKRKGIVVKEESNSQGLANFLKLQKQTASRQDFLIHRNQYYKELWKVLAPEGKAHILTAYYKEDSDPLSSFMLFTHKNTLYYPYGGTSSKHRDRQHSSRLMWESILFGKRKGCTLFDMWGATDNRNDPWWGFTRFKLGFGGTLVEFINSYDFVLNPAVYKTFNTAYNLFWKAIDIKRKLGNQ